MSTRPSIDPDAIVEALGDAVGKAKAEEIVGTATEDAGVGPKRRYTKGEAIEIADAIAALDGVSVFVRISANTLKTRIRVDDL